MNLELDDLELPTARWRIVEVKDSKHAWVVDVLFDNMLCSDEDPALAADEERGSQIVGLDFEYIWVPVPRADRVDGRLIFLGLGIWKFVCGKTRLSRHPRNV